MVIQVMLLKMTSPLSFLLVVISLLINTTVAQVVSLDSSNFDTIIKSNDVVIVNFFAEWCRFSQMLKPIYADAAKKFQDQPAGKIVFGSVDAEAQQEIAQRFSVNKYPTLKLFRKGELVKKEYRSQRSVEALSAYAQKQLDSGLRTVETPTELDALLQGAKRSSVGFFSQAAGLEYETFNMAASVLRDECTFILAAGPQFQSELQHGSQITFNGPNKEIYDGSLSDFDQLKKWLSERCVPLVREITFENAEELTEEGLPFLILFKHPDDVISQQLFTEAVIREIPDQKTTVNCLVADGKKFAHPLHHLAKSERDLPVIAIDSFRHMYLFSDFKDLQVQGKLRQFILDLHSGKLHREFHHGPDQPVATSVPPPSVFEKLKPSSNRYSLPGTKEEL